MACLVVYRSQNIKMRLIHTNLEIVSINAMQVYNIPFLQNVKQNTVESRDAYGKEFAM